ncbi:MAG: methylmalonyl-CoA epimerase [Candidatus Limnocylindrales bacterium]
MDRPLMPDLHAMLSPEGAGGLVETADAVDPVTLAATANEYGARFAELHGPTTKADVLEPIYASLGAPDWAGRNWDALEEILARPEHAHMGPVIIAWHDPARLVGEDATIFRAIIASAAEERARSGDGSLVVVAGPRAPSEVTAMPDLSLALGQLGKVHHVALIVGSIETALGFWRDALHAPLETIMDIEHDRVRIAFLTVGESKIELVEPTDDTTGVARFLASKGEGFHHVCFEVEDLAETLLRLEVQGLELIDSAPRRGAEGPVAFVHPRSCHGVLVELIEAPGGPSWMSLGIIPPAQGAQP